MKLSSLLVIAVALIALFFLFPKPQNEASSPQDQNKNSPKRYQKSTSISRSLPTGFPSSSRKTKDSDNGKNPEINELRKQLNEVTGKIERFSGPLNENILSSSVRIPFKEGDVIATGGYLTENGDYEFTFISPERLRFPGAPENAFRLNSETYSIHPDAISELKLNELATSARNTVDHAEIWDIDTLVKFDQLSSQLEGTNFRDVSNLVTIKNEDFFLHIGARDGGSFEINGRISDSEDGELELTFAVIRTPTESPKE